MSRTCDRCSKRQPQYEPGEFAKHDERDLPDDVVQPIAFNGFDGVLCKSCYFDWRDFRTFHGTLLNCDFHSLVIEALSKRLSNLKGTPDDVDQAVNQLQNYFNKSVAADKEVLALYRRWCLDYKE